jgi:acetyl esterase/lipase
MLRKTIEPRAALRLVAAPLLTYLLAAAAACVPPAAAASPVSAQSPVPLPATLSAAMRHSLDEAARAGPPPVDLRERRKLYDQIQLRDGDLQKRKYPVEIRAATMGGVPVRIVTPAHPFADKGLILLNVHGGGFVADSGSYTENIPIAALTGIPVVAVLYRFAPEHPFPSAVEDAIAVYRHLLQSHSAGKIGLYGTSAGAIIGPELMMRLKKDGLPLPAVLGMFSGDTDFARRGYSALRGERDGEIDLHQIFGWYARASEFTNPLVSPLYGDLHGFPPTLCISSTADFFLSSTSNFCRKLDESGVDARLVVFDGLPHAFWAYLKGPESDEAFAVMARFLRQHLVGTIHARH